MTPGRRVMLAFAQLSLASLAMHVCWMAGLPFAQALAVTLSLSLLLEMAASTPPWRW